MERKNIKVITNVLYEGRRILDIYEKHNSPTDGKKYDEFMLELTKTVVTENFKYIETKMFLEWLFEQKGNTLPKQSSGSIHTALSDFDGFISGIEGYCDELSEEEHDFAEEVYRGLFIY